MTVLMEHCDDKGHGALWWQGAWSIVMKGVLEYCVGRSHGLLWWNGSWSIVMTVVMEHFFLIQTECHKSYNHPHQFPQSHVINFFLSCSFVSTFMSSSIFHLNSENAYSLSSAVQSVTRNLYLSESFPWIPCRWNPFIGTYLQKHHSTPRSVCKWQKTLKWPWLKIWWKFIIMQLARKFSYFWDIRYKVITRIMT